jgi:hypothetical protein
VVLPEVLQVAQIFLTNQMPLSKCRAFEFTSANLRYVVGQCSAYGLFQRDDLQHRGISFFIGGIEDF